jgi:hypothetical protein
MANSFFDKTLAALENLSELKIRTLVGEFEYHPDDDDRKYELRFKKGGNIEGMVSRINLVLGDIDTEISPKFATEYSQLREFHLAKENQGHEIVKKNMEVLAEVAKTIAELIKSRKDSE